MRHKGTCSTLGLALAAIHVLLSSLSAVIVHGACMSLLILYFVLLVNTRSTPNTVVLLREDIYRIYTLYMIQIHNIVSVRWSVIRGIPYLRAGCIK